MESVRQQRGRRDEVEGRGKEGTDDEIQQLRIDGREDKDVEQMEVKKARR